MTKERGLPGPDPGPLPELTDAQQALYALCSPAAVANIDHARSLLLTSLRTSGWSLAKIARLFSVSKQLVSYWLVAR